MLDRILKSIAGNYNQKEINRFGIIIRDINHICSTYDAISDDELKQNTISFKERVKNWESLDSILPEAFATVKQVCKRMNWQVYEVRWEKMTWNMIPYDVQLIWWIVLHQGKIAEMKTGEWKTLAATLPVYLNALTQKWVHIVTVNDYLASRDAAWMWKLYEWLGLSVGCVTKETNANHRREEYAKDITYIENSELGFDYLRDNLVKSMKDRSLTWRPLNYAIVDEIDSILIDEARTPLIISQPKEEATEKYQYYAKIIQTLRPCSVKKRVSKWLLSELLSDEKKPKNIEDDWDYYIDEKTKTASLSGEWIERLEWILNVENIYKDLWYEEIHHIENALRAAAVYKKDKDYIISGQEILIVDEHTGRAMPWRRFSEWLHQAIEAKEWVEIKRESQTIATITYQNFFKQYAKLSGMTGTATTEGEEFNSIYDLDVLSIPTNKPTIRIDKTDKVFYNQKSKWNSVKEEIKLRNEIGQPLLIGTANIVTSEYLSKILERESIPHYVLNAKFFEKEAHIVGNAGRYKSVVVATNMAGRWTDIKLEDGLNDKLSKNYAKRIEKNLNNYNIKLLIYSEKEFDYTIDAIKDKFWFTEDDILNSEKIWFEKEDKKLKIIFNKSKKNPEDIFATIEIAAIESKSLPDFSLEISYGLFVLGTEKHESRRIDNQLRWRSWRQWDAGRSVFYVALDDEIMRKMWWERIQSMASMFLSKEDLESLELTQKQFTSAIERSQKQIEAWHFGTRKQLFDYDSIVNTQRQKIYGQRDEILMSDQSDDLKNNYIETTKSKILQDISLLINIKLNEAHSLKQPIDDLIATINKEFNVNLEDIKSKITNNSNITDFADDIIEVIKSKIKKSFESINQDKLYMIFKDVNLHYIDNLWIEHIDEMQYLRDKVWFMWYAQQDPLIIYKKESFEKFRNLVIRIKSETTNYILNIDYEWIQEQEKVEKIIIEKQKTDPNFINKLKSASNNIKDVMKIIQEEKDIKEKKVIFQDEDGVEVLEIGEPKVNNTIVNSKLRPNDKVNVKYKNWKVEYDVKYKKIKDLIEKGECDIL